MGCHNWLALSLSLFRQDPAVLGLGRFHVPGLYLFYWIPTFGFLSVRVLFKAKFPIRDSSELSEKTPKAKHGLGTSESWILCHFKATVHAMESLSVQSL